MRSNADTMTSDRDPCDIEMSGFSRQHQRQQLQRAPDGPRDLHELVRAVVPPDCRVGEAVVVRQLAHLERVPRRHDHRVPRALQLADDRQEERDVGRVVEVDPDASWPRVMRL